MNMDQTYNWINEMVPEDVYRKNLEIAESIYKDYSSAIDRAGLGQEIRRD